MRQPKKWFNQADIMPRKGKTATDGLKQIQAQLLGIDSVRSHSPSPCGIACGDSILLVPNSQDSRSHLSGLLSLIHPNVSTQGSPSSKRLSSPTSKVLWVFHHEPPANRVKKRDCS